MATISNPQEVTVGMTVNGKVAFSTSDPAMVGVLEATFAGSWKSDEDCRPWYVVPGLQIAGVDIELIDEEPPSIRRTDGEAIEELHRMMSGRLWDGAADFLEAIADVVKSTGRPIKPATGRSPKWSD